MNCPRCGSPNAVDTPWCVSCGARLRVETVQVKQGMAIASLVLGVLSLPTIGLLMIGAPIGLILGIVALVRANREPREYGGKGLAIGGIVTNALAIVLIPFIGIVAAIAIPSLLRARVSANEAAAIGDVRTMISAEAAFQNVNNGYYGTLECLNRPNSCLSEYPPNGPTFLDSTMASLDTKSGYRRTFHPGRPPAPGSAKSEASMERYAYVVVPAVPGRTGTRAFCGDSTGVVFYHLSGESNGAESGQCDPSYWQPLR